MARLPSAKKLDLFDMEVPDGMADMAMPPAQEHTKDPFRYDSGGRNSFHRKRVHRKLAGEARKTKLSEIIEEFPRYGPKMYEWAVDQNDPNLLKELFQLDISMAIKSAEQKHNDKKNEDDIDVDEDDNSYPQVDMQPALQIAAFDGKLECVKVFIEVGHANINTQDDKHTTPLTDAIVALVNKVLEHPRSVERKSHIETSHLFYAATARQESRDVVQCVLQSDCFGSPITQSQLNAIMQSLTAAVSRASRASVRLMLPFLTEKKEDCSFQYVDLPEENQISSFTATEDAMMKQDIPELFKLIWETFLCGPNEHEGTHNQPIVTKQDRLHRRLISACAEGCVETCRLLVDGYGGDVDYVSYKIFSTPLGRATGSPASSLERRLPVAKYLLEEKHANIHLANGEFSKGASPLALLLKCGGREDQEEMINLLLKNDGPLEEIGGDVWKALEEAEAEARVKLCLVLHEGAGDPVKLVTHGTWPVQIGIDATKEEWESCIESIQIRKSDEVLAAEDPNRRPLAWDSG
ncbi:E3 ubiquitin-protein ligase mib1 [Paraconiothyrium brasiliense]|uniref:E3 ubiquitin-protein ligase mib1 n=1 Tax=Paraconiothyrium brasiliense TaxID=300254 RepID=A0ABR3RL69_9PLEO